jgi:hypothetical protein
MANYLHDDEGEQEAQIKRNKRRKRCPKNATAKRTFVRMEIGSLSE